MKEKLLLIWRRGDWLGYLMLAGWIALTAVFIWQKFLR